MCVSLSLLAHALALHHDAVRRLQDVPTTQDADACVRVIHNREAVHLAPHNHICRIFQRCGVVDDGGVVAHCARGLTSGSIPPLLLVFEAVPHATQTAAELVTPTHGREDTDAVVQVPRSCVLRVA